MRTESQIYQETTDTYLDGLPMDAPIDPKKIERELLEAIIYNIKAENNTRDNDMRIRIPGGLPPEVVAHTVLRLYPIAKLSFAQPGDEGDRATMPLAMYRDHGPDEGLYVVGDDAIGELVRRYNYRFRSKDVKDVLYQISLEAPVRYPTADRDLIAVNNGIFDYKTKTLMPFGPDHVFISKSRVDYKPFAQNPVIANADGTLWDVKSWVDSLTDDPALRHLLWQIIGAIIRPYVSWDKALIFYATGGNNGKGTLCTLLHNLCGPGTCASISMENMGKDFMLESLTHATAIICDENNVGGFLDSCASFKSLVTGDRLQINRKNKSAITAKFRGLVVQCMNDMPKVKDKTGSFARRLLIVPFEKRFEGHENKSIKNDYLNRKEVLEYVLYKVLNTDYYEFSIPSACEEMLGDFKTNNDPVRRFLEYILPEAQWNILPYDFLWDLYRQWFKGDAPAGTSINKDTFIKAVLDAVGTTPEWGWTAQDPKKRFRVRRGCMECYEPLLERYGLTQKWGAELSGPGVPPLCMVTAHYPATPGNRFLQKLTRGLVRMSDEQVDAVLEEQAGQILGEFVEWFWNDPAGGLAWYVAGCGDEDGGKEQAAWRLASSKDDMYGVMPVRRDFQQHRVLDRKYSADELVAAAQDHWFRTHGEDPAAMRARAGEAMDAFADWFWHNGVVEYRVSGPVTGTVAPEDARRYAEDRDELAHLLGTAIWGYQDRVLVQTLFTTDELLDLIKAYWFEHYGNAAARKGA